MDATPVNVRFPPAELKSLDTWIGSQPEPRPSRPEAVRRMVQQALPAPPLLDSPRALSKEEIAAAFARGAGPPEAMPPSSSRKRPSPKPAPKPPAMKAQPEATPTLTSRRPARALSKWDVAAAVARAEGRRK